jgi:hypothetical protein
MHDRNDAPTARVVGSVTRPALDDSLFAPGEMTRHLVSPTVAVAVMMATLLSARMLHWLPHPRPPLGVDMASSRALPAANAKETGARSRRVTGSRPPRS